MKRLLILFALLCLGSPLPSNVAAEDLKIVDPAGLTRAFTHMSGTATVVVTLKGAEKSGAAPELKLSNVDGVAADVAGVATSEHEYAFSHVGAGTWTVRASGAPIVVETVKINP